MAPAHFFPPPQKCVFSKTAHTRCCQFKKTSNTTHNFTNSEFSGRLRDLDVISLFSQFYNDGKFLNVLVCWGLWLAHILNENENILAGTKKSTWKEEAKQPRRPKQCQSNIEKSSSPRPLSSWKLVMIFLIVYEIGEDAYVHVVCKIKLKRELFLLNFIKRIQLPEMNTQLKSICWE